MFRFGIQKEKELYSIIKKEKLLQTGKSNKHNNNNDNKTNTTAQIKQHEDLIKDTKFHSLERFLVGKAVNFLLLNKDYKTILVDIFERTEDMYIDYDELLGVPKTHTVLLHKYTNTENDNSTQNKNYNVEVIDPSNFSFSAHLKYLNIDGCKLETLVTPIKQEIKIYSRPIEKKDNINKSKIGRGFDEYRDCVDISVKLAFGFYNSDKKLSITPSKKSIVINDEIVKMISNDYTTINKNLNALYPGVGRPCNRVKQTSDIDTSKLYYKLEKSIIVKIDIIEKSKKLSVNKDWIDTLENNLLAKVIDITLETKQDKIKDLLETYRLEYLSSKKLLKNVNEKETSTRVIGNKNVVMENNILEYLTIVNLQLDETITEILGECSNEFNVFLTTNE